jgi:hypothetical protein
MEVNKMLTYILKMFFLAAPYVVLVSELLNSEKKPLSWPWAYNARVFVSILRRRWRYISFSAFDLWTTYYIDNKILLKWSDLRLGLAIASLILWE